MSQIFVMIAAGNYREFTIFPAVNKPMFPVDAARIKRGVFMVSQSLWFANTIKGIDMNGQNKRAYTFK